MTIASLPAEEFRRLVELIVAAEREEFGRLKTNSMIQLQKWLETGTIENPWNDAAMRDLNFTGFMTQVYRRCRG